MSSMTPSAMLALSEDVRAALDNLALQEVLSQSHITGQDVRSALGNAPVCSCVRGQYLCPVARALWNSVTAAWDYYQANRLNPEAWRKYNEAREAYENHLS